MCKICVAFYIGYTLDVLIQLLFHNSIKMLKHSEYSVFYVLCQNKTQMQSFSIYLSIS